MRLLLPFVAVLLAPMPLGAWVQTSTCLDEPALAPTTTPPCQGDEIPKPFAWPQWTVEYHIGVNQSATIPDDRADAALRAAIEVWNVPDCSDFAFEYAGESGLTRTVPDDRINVVMFRNDDWPYSSSAIAVTSVTADGTGKIVDADLEVNEVHHTFGFAEESGNNVWDLPNAVAHEAGHFLGLDHTPIDDATMAFDTTPGETRKRDLHPDDIEGLCTIYPAGEEPTDPGDPRDCGCCCSAVGTQLPAPLLLLGAAFFAGRRRRRHRRT